VLCFHLFKKVSYIVVMTLHITDFHPVVLSGISFVPQQIFGMSECILVIVTGI
jgi:hypothetical protein